MKVYNLYTYQLLKEILQALKELEEELENL